jgi:hypothetical protein
MTALPQNADGLRSGGAADDDDLHSLSPVSSYAGALLPLENEGSCMAM